MAATNMPTWAAAPSRNVSGRPSRGRKSVSTPTPRKMMGGSSSVLIPRRSGPMMPSPYGAHFGQGKIGQNGAEADGDQQQRLVFFVMAR